ncbi:tRNA (adenosine(37)-N6)-threonylcarbamoyltransferase complex transferase subunit TsaD [Sulfobacillus thermosulfidooxidans]|nr:tRNA (adenosine(37)-N6)-threonylcarbamoyltransferase complex transferase subunit TsaD [Sulfobacillus thermosulfidooxidans]OLZ15704.1 tRNA (adenosine(37)-N6)-threonylcarbamoyltransferase complex transferase subunit TsaD [Sulfobacillus thermosulfidooxidans]OLZ18450.1 tRNA (adenosine(37)-N6)-threonylcarbamoyltransferase complex transferase subunit TsaD [Sulfobacillus thermosulfidooxidans]
MLGIESSCDETAAAIVEDGRHLIATTLSSSAQIHAKYGGVVPEVAAREHALAILPVVDAVLTESSLTLQDLDAIAVTQGPGLLGALLVGVTFAKTLGAALNIPVIGVHHLEAHLYANALVDALHFPALALLVSGGHTSLLLWRDYLQWELLGETRDDAAGEAFDKGARILGLGYPGGPEIERLARQAKNKSLHLPIANLGDTLDFSFSGVKTATQALWKDHSHEPEEVAYALQQAVIKALVKNVEKALNRYPVEHLYVAGGVSANQALAEALRHLGQVRNIHIHIPPTAYCTDNAAMVAALGYYLWQAGKSMGPFEGPHAVLPLA